MIERYLAGEPEVSATPRIEIREAAKSFGTLQVFRGVSLEVGESEVLAVIGPSGCGKTTLLRCIDGLIPLTEGEITVERERVAAPR